MMGGLDMGSWFALAAIILGPPLVLAAILKKLGRSRIWALLWFVFLAAFYAWFVWSYDR
jgi:hypothetical protein